MVHVLEDFFPLEKLLYNWKLTRNTIILLYYFPLKDSYLLQYQQIMIFFGHDFNQLYSILTFYNTSIFTLHELINCMILIWKKYQNIQILYNLRYYTRNCVLPCAVLPKLLPHYWFSLWCMYNIKWKIVYLLKILVTFYNCIYVDTFHNSCKENHSDQES